MRLVTRHPVPAQRSLGAHLDFIRLGAGRARRRPAATDGASPPVSDVDAMFADGKQLGDE